MRLRLIVEPQGTLLDELHAGHAGKGLRMRGDAEEMIDAESNVVGDVRVANGMVEEQLAIHPHRDLGTDKRHVRLLELEVVRDVIQRCLDCIDIGHQSFLCRVA